jgi:hypothetical protein
VEESSEIPPLPVSSIKLKVSFRFSNLALIIITPPLNILKGNFVIRLAFGEDRISCALRQKGKRINIMKHLIFFMQ